MKKKEKGAKKTKQSRKNKEVMVVHGICQCESCKKIRGKNKNEGLIYMDPPYHGASPNLYGTKPWTEVDFVKLRNDFHELACLGFKIILSMSDTPFIRELFRGYNIKEMKFVYQANQRKKVTELLITNMWDEEIKEAMKNSPVKDSKEVLQEPIILQRVIGKNDKSL